MNNDKEKDNLSNELNTGKIQTNDDGLGLFPANNLLRKNADNLVISEAMIDEKPLRTEKTLELEEQNDDQ
jgi:hypothetical protein